MDTKKSVHNDVKLALQMLNEKIESLKAKVDKLCETTECFEARPDRTLKSPPNESKP